MIRSEEEWGETLGAFQAAALGLASWDEALRGLAGATGSRYGQLIGIGGDAAVPFNWLTDMPREAAEEFVAVSGADPQVNSRVRIGGRAPELAVLSEADFQTEEDMRRWPDYGELIRRYDFPFICLARC